MGEGGNKGRKGREEGKRRGQRQGKAGRAHGIYMITQLVENKRAKMDECSKRNLRGRKSESERETR